jgi:hypothetical protein
MLDAQAILNQARSGSAPASWHVYHARAAFFRRRAMVGSAYIVLLAATILLGYIYPDSALFRIGWFVQLITGIQIVLRLHPLIQSFFAATSTKARLLILMPEGFVLDGTREPLAVRYASYKSLHTRPSLESWWLGKSAVVAAEDVGYGTRAWRIDARFDDPGAIARRIVADQAAYVAAHGWAGWRYVPPPQQIEVGW